MIRRSMGRDEGIGVGASTSVGAGVGPGAWGNTR